MLPFLKGMLDKLLFGRRRKEPVAFSHVFEHFQNMLLQDHQRAMELMADLGEKTGGDYIFDRKYLQDSVAELQTLLLRMVRSLNLIGSDRYLSLYSALDRVLPAEWELSSRLKSWDAPLVVTLNNAPLDNPELTGGKANTLVEIIHRIGLPVPDGFVITSWGYYRFLEHNRLETRIREALEAWMSGKDDLDKASDQIRGGILSGTVPPDLAKAIRRRAGKAKHNWSVRSSAYGEDGELSFAGLYQTILNVPTTQILEAYKQVIASLYAPESINYRRQMGTIGEEVAMSVLCQEMVHSRASGVLQTVNPNSSKLGRMAIHASFGLGRTTADGRDALDCYIVDKQAPYIVRESRIARKELSVRSATGGGEEEFVLSHAEGSQPAISEATVKSLAMWGVALERYFKHPLEIEWAVDADGNCRLLQSRPLKLPEAANEEPWETSSSWKALTQGVGSIAYAGIGAGPVRMVQSNRDMAEFPDGSVLVARYTAPWLARIVPKARAIISERGSVAGHLATIAREFRVPALIGVENATEILSQGMVVTLDAHHRVIYEGRVEELIRRERMQPMAFDEAPEFRLLRRILQRVAPLHLVDPHSYDFTPEGCKSVHDMIRFIHEKAVQELLDLPSVLKHFKGARVWTLQSDVPMQLKILNLGGGLDPFAEGTVILPDQIKSLPLKALWAGISRPGAWNTEPVALDFKSLMSSFTKSWDVKGAALPGPNLAAVSDTYMNLHLRLGYHLNLIDARMEDDDNQNHIYFRFVGGVTDFTRRSRRAQLLADILARYHFKVTVKGDLVVGRILHFPKEEIERRLLALGSLIGFTRQLDVQLKTDQDIAESVSAFFEKHGDAADPTIAGQLQ
jgi:pyruvate,water dikinase